MMGIRHDKEFFGFSCGVESAAAEAQGLSLFTGDQQNRARSDC